MIHSFQEVSTFLNNKLSFVITTSIYILNDLKEKYSLGYKINSVLTFQIHSFIPLKHWNLRSQKKKLSSATETTIKTKNSPSRSMHIVFASSASLKKMLSCMKIQT